MKTEALSVAAPYLIEQDYSAYTDEQHAVWAELVGRVLPELEKHAARDYLDGFQIIGLQTDRLPRLARSARGWSRAPAGIRRRSADSCPRRRSLRCWQRAAFPPPPGCAAASRSNTRPSPTSSTTSSAMCRCTRTRLRGLSRALRPRLRIASKTLKFWRSSAASSGTRLSSA